MSRVARGVVNVACGGVHVEHLVGVLGGQAGDVTCVAQQSVTQRVATLVRFVRQLQSAVVQRFPTISQ